MNQKVPSGGANDAFTLKISEVVNLLSKVRTTTPAGKDALSEFLTHDRFARALFMRAPRDLFESRSSAELATIATRAAEGVTEVVEQRRDEVSLRTWREKNRTTAILSLSDRPFIVNTVTECLRSHHLSARIFLHPIFLIQERRVSLCYLEWDTQPESLHAEVERDLRESLSTLIPVTDDFPKMLGHAETIARVVGHSSYQGSIPKSETAEHGAFLQWLLDEHFVFVGYTAFAANELAAGRARAESSLGLFRTTNATAALVNGEIGTAARRAFTDDAPLAIARLRVESPVHRRRRLLQILIQERGPDGRALRFHAFIGLLTSRALSEESSRAPIIRGKVRQVIEREELIERSHDFKNVHSVVDQMPKDEALVRFGEDIHSIIHATLELQSSNTHRTLLLHDSLFQDFTLVVVMPRDRFRTDIGKRVRSHIEQHLLASLPQGCSRRCGFVQDTGHKPHTRLYFSFAGNGQALGSETVAELTVLIDSIMLTWDEQLARAFESSSYTAATLEKYSSAFSLEYQTLLPVSECLRDIAIIESLSPTTPIRVVMAPALKRESHRSNTHAVTVYAAEQEFTISSVVPRLENGGFEVINEHSDVVVPKGGLPIHIHRFVVCHRGGLEIAPQLFDRDFGPALAQVLAGQAHDDPLNGLMLSAQLSLRAVTLLRAYAYLLWQVDKSATRRTIVTTLAQFPRFAAAFYRIFSLRFDPQSSDSVEKRSTVVHAELKKLRDELRNIKDITRDRVLRALAQLIEHTVRTNFFLDQSTLALKLASEQIDIMPQPRPKFEIFVMGPRVEGVHLRSGMVARGGIRWSDRHEDYRSEVLGLVKTQKIKNVVIVPTGAKGGFVVKNLPTATANIGAAVEASYCDFIRALLSITDNRVGDKIVPPQRVVRYDGDDPYLVVAADKGTATFSDMANRIAQDEYSFWLGDAFASGGSNGYDHKLYGITARGAWECVKRNFNDASIDYEGKPFTVVGVGDMSGDVFGNGLLLSPQMRLLAAFDHRHIFIDPVADPVAGFRERQRLFNLKGSTWENYDTALIGKGGGVFSRHEKDIALTPEIRQALGIPSEVGSTVSGEELITHILTAPCDLLWNGGIGTYVKASFESHQDAKDSTNDRVRVNARDVRARGVAEGGNLGFTQKARVEFAERGGLVNTDAIDNSGGVDLSDHEVNLKILFAGLLREKKITLEERNKLLREMASEVVEDVLNHNRGHALLLSFAVKRSKRDMDLFQTLIRHLVKGGYVNRRLESLPEEDEMAARAAKGTGLTRPELAVCLAGTKMWVKDQLLGSHLPNEPLLQQLLLDYFPDLVRSRFKSEILEHPLARHIIVMQVTNLLLELFGITFLSRMVDQEHVSPEVALRSMVAALFLLDAVPLVARLRALDTPAHAKTYLQVRSDLGYGLRDTASWLMLHHQSLTSCDELVQLYRGPLTTLLGRIEDVVVGDDRQKLQKRRNRLRETIREPMDADLLAIMPRISLLLETLWLAKSAGKEPLPVAQVYARVWDELQISDLRALEKQMNPRDRWDEELLASAALDIRSGLSKVTHRLLQKGTLLSRDVNAKLKESPSLALLRAVVDELKEKGPRITVFAMAGRKVRDFVV